MAGRIFLVTLIALVLSTWIFEVEVEAQKGDKLGKACDTEGAINGSTLISRRYETCGVVKNITTIEVCENGQWTEICDGNFTQEDAQVICRDLGHSAIRATAGYLNQGVGSSTASYYPECNGQESSISECDHVPLLECSSPKVYVTCFVDDPCSNVSAEPTSASPATQLFIATSVASPPHTTTGTDSTTDSSNSDTNNASAPRSGEQSPFSITTIAAIIAPVVGILLLLIFVILLMFIVLVCKRSTHRKQNFNDQVSPDSPVKVHNNQTERYKDLEAGTYSELNNSTVTQHQVPVYDTVKNKSRDLSEVSASDSNEDMDNHTYSALDPDAIYTQIPPHLGLGPGNSKTLPVGMKDVSPSELYQKLDRTMSLPRTTGPSGSGSPGYMLTHAVNRTALALASGNISETDLASPRSDASIKYPSPHGSPKQHHSSSSQSSTSKEELPLIRNPTNAQMENYYHVLDQGAPTVVAAAASGIATTANSDIDSQVSTDAVCNQQILDNRRQPHCHSSPRRQRQRAGAAGPGPGDMMVAAEGGDQQHFYATLEPSVRAQLTPPSRHDTRQRSQSQSTTLNNRSPPQQRQRMQSSGSNGDVRVNYSGQRVMNNFSPTSLQPPNVAAAATAAEVTNTLV